jgi:hypothetical protein
MSRRYKARVKVSPSHCVFHKTCLFLLLNCVIIISIYNPQVCQKHNLQKSSSTYLALLQMIYKTMGFGIVALQQTFTMHPPQTTTPASPPAIMHK